MTAVLGSTGAIATSCTFPDFNIIISDGTGASGGASSSSGGPTTGGSGAGAASNSSTTTTTTGGGDGGSGATGGAPCAKGDCSASEDKDGDSHLDADCAPGGAGGVGAAYDDCNDCNGEVHPGQTDWFEDELPANGGYDYNCSGFEEPEFGNVVCSGALCADKTNVFLTVTPTNVACGSKGSFGNCTLLPLCGATETDMKTQACH